MLAIAKNRLLRGHKSNYFWIGDKEKAAKGMEVIFQLSRNKVFEYYDLYPRFISVVLSALTDLDQFMLSSCTA